MHAHFKLTPHGWICKKVWPDIKFDFEISGRSLFMDVARAPKIGFCKRPHKYL